MSAVIALLATVVPLYVMAVYDRVVGAGSAITLISLLMGVGLAVIGELAMRGLRARLLAKVGARIDVLVGRSVLERLMRLPPATTESSTVGAQVARVKDFETVREFLTGPSAAAVLDVPFSFIIIGLVFWLAGPLGLVPTIGAALLVALGLIARGGLRRRVGESARLRPPGRSWRWKPSPITGCCAPRAPWGRGCTATAHGRPTPPARLCAPTPTRACWGPWPMASWCRREWPLCGSAPSR